MGFQDVINEIKAIEELQRLEVRDMTVDETTEQRLKRVYEERDHYREIALTLPAQLASAQSLLSRATRFVFGGCCAVNMFQDCKNADAMWRVYRLRDIVKFGDCIGKDLTREAACALAMKEGL